MSADDYTYAWSLYVCGAIGLLIVFWRMTRWISIDMLREPLRLIACVGLLFPFPVEKGLHDWAPALLMFAFESVFAGMESAARTGSPLLTVCIFVLVVIGIPQQWWLYRRRHLRQLEWEDNEAYDELVEDSESYSHSVYSADRFSTDRDTDDRYSADRSANNRSSNKRSSNNRSSNKRNSSRRYTPRR